MNQSQPVNSGDSTRQRVGENGLGSTFATGVAANEALLRWGNFSRLAQHLHNDNPETHFLMGIADYTKPERAIYCQSKSQLFPVGVTSSFEAMHGRTEEPFSAGVYTPNRDGLSRWACVDIDAHHPEEEEQAGVMLRSLLHVLKARAALLDQQGICCLALNSGRGFHLWLIGRELRAWIDWRKLMVSLLHRAGLEVADGIELFPSSRSQHGVRLPGAANVKTWDPLSGDYACSTVVAAYGWEELTGFLQTRYHPLPFSPYKRGQGKTGNKKKTSFVPPKTLEEHIAAKRILDAYPVTQPSCRHDQLLALVGDGSFHFSRKQLRELAILQYERAEPPPETTLTGHLREFAKAYEAWLIELTSRLSQAEQAALTKMSTDYRRAAFVIVQNFARYAIASRKWGKDGRFPLSGLDLATRLGVGTNAAYKVRKALERAGCIRRVSRGVPKKTADHFVWEISLHASPATANS